MGGQSKGDADRHPLRDVVQCYGQYQEGGAAAGGFALFAVEGFRCEVGEQIVHGQKENDAKDRSTSGGQPTGIPMASASSMAGMSRDHMLAAIITPAANPSRTR